MSPIALIAQAEASWWFFGEFAGLDFNGLSPTPVTGSLDTIEGCSAISDRCGQLQMYTDGRTIWDRNGNPFPGANGNLLGNSSAAQSGIIVPDIIAPGIYYVFTVSTGSAPVVNYNIVNMNARGGLGDVLPGRINIPLRTDGQEKISAVLHADGRSYWLITYETNVYQAFRVAGGGVNPVPVVSTINSNIVTDGRGTIKFSPDGTRVANVSVNDNGAVIADFDNSTGIVSNEIQLGGLGVSNECYGVEFSPNSQLLYVDANSINGSNGCGGNNTKNIYQYNLTQANFQNNPVSIFSRNNYEARGALQQAVDGRIYSPRTCTRFLNVIQNPNQVGTAANFVENAITLLPGTEVREGLPPFITSFFSPDFRAQVAGNMGGSPGAIGTEFCVTDTILFDSSANDFCPTDTVFWDFGDGIGSSNQFNPTYQYTTAGTYNVTLTVTGSSFVVDNTITLEIFDTPTANPVPDLFFCSGSASESLDLDALVTPGLLGGQNPADVNVTYHASLAAAQNDLGAFTFPRTFTAGVTTVFARLENNNAITDQCFETAEIDIIIGQEPSVGAVTDITVCDLAPFDGQEDVDLTVRVTEALAGQDPTQFSVSFFANQSDADSNINELNASAFAANDGDQVVARVEGPDRCFNTTTFTVNVSAPPSIGMVPDLEVCDDLAADGVENVNLTVQDAAVLDGQNAANFTITYHDDQADATAGINDLPNPVSITDGDVIFARITDANGCFNTTSFTVNILSNPTIGAPSDLTLCEDDLTNNTADFDLTSQDAAVLAGQDAALFSVAYFGSEADAVANTGALNSPFAGTDGTVIFARITDNATGCINVAPFTLNVNPAPAITGIADIEECDDIPSDGMLDIDLTLQNAAILNGLDPADFTLQYFPSDADADMDTNELMSPYTAMDNDFVVALVTDNTTGCTNRINFNIRVYDEPAIGQPMDITVCDEVPIDGIQQIDLSEQDLDVLNGQSSTDFSVAYFGSQADAENDVNQLSTLYDASDMDVITARIMDNSTGCTNFASFSVTVEGCELILPQGISPNGDGANDTLEIVNLQQQGDFTLKVFNRNGTMVYETNSVNYVPWAGASSEGGSGLLPMGTYFYTIEFRDPTIEDIVKWVYLTY
jgi:gliding motility-associated-like protein